MVFLLPAALLQIEHKERHGPGEFLISGQELGHFERQFRIEVEILAQRLQPGFYINLRILADSDFQQDFFGIGLVFFIKAGLQQAAGLGVLAVAIGEFGLEKPCQGVETAIGHFLPEFGSGVVLQQKSELVQPETFIKVLKQSRQCGPGQDF